MAIHKHNISYYSFAVKVTISWGSIPASSDTVESEGQADEAVLNTVHRKKNPKKIPVNNIKGLCHEMDIFKGLK
jgi:hypothetical protein